MESKRSVLLVLSLLICLSLAGIVAADEFVNCWQYQGNQSQCNAQSGKCLWKPAENNTWCMDSVGCCDQLNCWNFDGDQSGCNNAVSTYNLTCGWEANDKNQNSWCPFKSVGDWSPSGQIDNISDVGCCQMQGCWNRDSTNETYCEDPTYLNGICEWHHKNASNQLDYDPWCMDSVGCCVVPPCNNFNGNQSKCKTAESLMFPCNWNNGSQTCGAAGCELYNNNSNDCLGNGCNYNPSNGGCMPPSSDFVGEGGGAEHCWFADMNPGVCMNVSGCVYCSNTNGLINVQNGGGNISKSTSFCYNKPEGYCEGHQSDASGIEFTASKTYFNVTLATDNIECSDVRVKNSCDCGPFPGCKWGNSSALTGNYCQKINRTKTTDEMSICTPKIGGEEIKFCEDSKITTADNCTWLATTFNMPCNWDNTSNKCKFMFDSVFKGGPIGDFWEIDNTNGGESACQAAKGIWSCEQYEDFDGSIKNDCFCKQGTTSGGGMFENCNSFCGACEWFYQNGTEVSSVSDAQIACLASSLGYCQYQNNTNAANGYGTCLPPQQFKFGGGDCNTDCKSCGIVSTDVNIQQEKCEQSNAGCKWITDSYGGFCVGNSKKVCSQDCMSCPTETDCLNTANLSNPLSCTWDSTYYYCKPTGFDGEVCFDGIDNDGDDSTDCNDKDCSFDKACGGDSFGNCGQYNSNATCANGQVILAGQNYNCTWISDTWSNSLRCANPGEQCWSFEENEVMCNATSGCRWVNLTVEDGPGAGWCDVKKSTGKVCNGLNTTNCSQNQYCSWSDPDGVGGGPGFCDFSIFTQCHQLWNSSSCSANGNCTWSNDFMGPMMEGMGGHCEPNCFNSNFNSTGCVDSKPMCEWVETACDPSFYADCADYDGNITACEEKPSCQYYNSTGEELCDPKSGGDKFAGAGFGGGGAANPFGGGIMMGPIQNAQGIFNNMEFFHLGDDTDVGPIPSEPGKQDWNTPTGWGTSTTEQNDTLEAVDIRYFGIKDLGQELGFGIGVTQTKKAAMCNGKPTHFYNEMGLPTAVNNGTNTTRFIWYLDTDGNSSNNCNATDQDGNKLQGFEFMINYLEQWSTQNKTTDTKTFYKCSGGSWSPTSVALYVDRGISCQMVGGAGIAVSYEDLESYTTMYNASEVMRVFVISGHNATFITDSAGPGYYTKGTVDWKPECCFCPGDPDIDGDGKPASTDEECAFIKDKGFMSFEDCFNNKDDNNDDLVDCDDPICTPMPKCGGSFNFIANANDKKSPMVLFQMVDEWSDGAFIKFDTDEPAKGAVLFYFNDSSCVTVNATLDDLGDPSFTFDDYKPFHGINLDYNILGYSLQTGTDYFFKTRVIDPSNNTAKSACLNFTTKTETKKVLFDLDLDAGYEVDLMCNGYNKTNWNGSYAIKVNTSITKNCNMTIECDDGNYDMTFVGVDITQPQDIDLQNKLVCNTTQKMIGMDSDEEAWSENLFSFGMGGANDYIIEEFPVAYNANNIFKHCDEDNISDCTDSTAYVNCTGNTTETECKIPTSIGYSGHYINVYSGGGDNNNGGSGGGSSTPIVTPPVATPVAPAVPAEPTPKKEVAKETTPASVVAETTTETSVKAERRETRETAKKVDKKTKRDLAGKAFDQLFGGAGSGMGALVVLVLIVVIIVGVVYYKKKQK